MKKERSTEQLLNQFYQSISGSGKSTFGRDMFYKSLSEVEAIKLDAALPKETSKSWYVGSIAYKTIMSSTLEQLKNSRKYYQLAIETHKKDKNKTEEIFFTEGLELINKRIKSLSK